MVPSRRNEWSEMQLLTAVYQRSSNHLHAYVACVALLQEEMSVQ